MNNIQDVIKQHEDNIIKEGRYLQGRYSATYLPIWFLFPVAMLFLITWLSPEIEFNFIFNTLNIIFGSLLGLFFWWVWRSSSKSSIQYNKRQLLVIGSNKITEDLKDDFFTKLVEINFKYIDRYYDRTESQAKSAFSITVFVAVVSFLFILSGIIMSFLDKQSTANLATISGILGEFIAGVFFYLYNSTVKKMSEYHSKLVLTQNIGIALKVSETLPEAERSKVQTNLVEALTDKINNHLTNVNVA